MCRNLGADINADPFTPSPDLNGDYYQWGQPIPAATRDAIIGTWSATTPTTGYGSNSTALDSKIKSASDPCPPGYRVPTYAEWEGVRNNTTLNPRDNRGTWTGDSWSGTMFGDNLFLPATGRRNSSNGTLVERGTTGSYWSNRRGATTTIYSLYFSGPGSSVGAVSRAEGETIRCIAE